MKYLALLLLLFLPATAFAQHLDVPGAPHTTIHDNVTGTDIQIGIWAEATPFGDTIGLYEKSAQGWLGVWVSNLYDPHFPAQNQTPDGAKALIVSLLPQLNGAILNRFAISQTGPKPSGIGSIDAVNKALYVGFTFKVLPDGTTTFTTN